MDLFNMENTINQIKNIIKEELGHFFAWIIF
ncbi:hypothetical protein LCGC14_1968900 [marine sediment metagenome]|uniref:Uncharacterized protein n=1 Tax=marine sediment metagenome TaxID=412755 RepID=A0A0F9I9B7_9ZZZZ